MRTGRALKFVAAMLGGGVALGAGNCLPDNYWADFMGDTISDTVGLILEDVISDAVDAVDPALDVNQL